MSYWLLDKPNPNGPFYYTTRRRPLVGIVVHCTAGLEDLDLIGPDTSAERTADYAATTTRAVSWHSGSDTDSIIELLPASYTAFQTRGYNSSTYGHEFSKKDMVWSDESPEWVTATLTMPAAHLRKVATDAGIPIRHISKAQLDKAIAAGDPSQGGFVGHTQLDPPPRRYDPGADFPWDRFLSLVKGEDDMTPTQARIEVATAWYMKAGVWMDGKTGEDPQARLTRLAEAFRKGERTIEDIVRFVGRVRTPTVGEAVPAWVLDPTAPASAPIIPSTNGMTQAAADRRYLIRGNQYKVG